MMNRQYDRDQAYRFNGRGGRDPWDHTRMPYRRPHGRSPLPAYPGAENIPGRVGCGCDLPTAPRGHSPAPEAIPTRAAPPMAADRAVGLSGCGCGSPDLNRGRDDRRNGGCGCDNGCDHDIGCGRNRNIPRGDCDGQKHKLAEKIHAVDFALYEVILYLDVYPHSCDALETYHKLKAQREALHAEYEKTYGPLTPFGSQSHTSWDWFDGPFPWEYDAE